MNLITHRDIQIFFVNHINLSMGLQKTLRTILRDMFEQALMDDLCRKNSTNGVKLRSTYKEKEKKILNEDQRRKAIEWSIENKQYDVLTVLKTGIRRGEVLGLRWQDVDFEGRCLYINQSYCDAVEKGGAPDMELKSESSRRVIPVDDELLDCIRKLPRTGELVFPYTSAKAYGMHISCVLKRMAEGCGMEYVTLHGLRHTYGTVLKNRGVNVYDISKLLGHSDIKVTADIYIHDDVETLRRAIGPDV